MKKITLLVVLLLCMLPVYAIGGAEVKASILRYEPTPAEQGNTIDVWIQLSNAGTKADRVFIKFEPEYPFSIPPGQEDEIDVGIVAATEDKVVRFVVFVDPQAPNGEQDLEFLYKYSSVDEWVQMEAPVNIQTQNAVLLVEEYKVTPELVVPGQQATLDLVLRNAGSIGVKNIDVGIELEDGSFSTIGSGAKKRVNYVAQGQTEKVSFKLASDTSTLVKLYTVPVELNYQDERNKDYSETAKISLPVNAEPELSLHVDSTDFESKKKPGTVSLKVINKGVADLKYVDVQLVKTDDYEILSPSNEAYVGNLDNDDFETVDFIIKPEVKEPRLKVKLSFKDAYNKDISQDYDLPLRIITDSDLGKGGFSFGKLVGLLIIIGAGWYWWKKRKKKKTKRK